MPRERVDHLPPNALFELIEVCWRLRPTASRDAGNNGERGCGLARHGWKLA
jgi:hypothetical protein